MASSPLPVCWGGGLAAHCLLLALGRPLRPYGAPSALQEWETQHRPVPQESVLISSEGVNKGLSRVTLAY